MGGGGRVKTRGSLSADVRYLRQETDAARDGSAEVLFVVGRLVGTMRELCVGGLKEYLINYVWVDIICMFCERKCKTMRDLRADIRCKSFRQKCKKY